ncbi:hypothetical protein [Solidesulfovibrio sp.]
MDGMELIAAERRRQVEEKGFTAEHDDQHQDSELAFAACYFGIPCMFREGDETIFPATLFKQTGWDLNSATREGKSRIERLAIAGSLIAAEIDRLIRAGEE